MAKQEKKFILFPVKELLLKILERFEDISLSRLAEQREEKTIEFIDHSDDIWN